MSFNPATFTTNDMDHLRARKIMRVTTRKAGEDDLKFGSTALFDQP